MRFWIVPPKAGSMIEFKLLLNLTVSPIPGTKPASQLRGLDHKLLIVPVKTGPAKEKSHPELPREFLLWRGAIGGPWILTLAEFWTST